MKVGYLPPELMQEREHRDTRDEHERDELPGEWEEYDTRDGGYGVRVRVK